MVKEIKTIIDFKNILDNTEFIVIDFFATWCQPCKKILPFIENLKEKYPNVNFFKINIDNENTIPVVDACEVINLPTICFFEHGKFITKVIGANEHQIEETIKQLTNKN